MRRERDTAPSATLVGFRNRGYCCDIARAPGSPPLAEPPILKLARCRQVQRPDCCDYTCINLPWFISNRALITYCGLTMRRQPVIERLLYMLSYNSISLEQHSCPPPFLRQLWAIVRLRDGRFYICGQIFWKTYSTYSIQYLARNFDEYFYRKENFAKRLILHTSSLQSVFWKPL